MLFGAQSLFLRAIEIAHITRSPRRFLRIPLLSLPIDVDGTLLGLPTTEKAGVGPILAIWLGTANLTRRWSVRMQSAQQGARAKLLRSSVESTGSLYLKYNKVFSWRPERTKRVSTS
jgi:hypothetical protein